MVITIITNNQFFFLHIKRKVFYPSHLCFDSEMIRVNDKKKNNNNPSIAAATTIFTLTIIIMAASTMTAPALATTAATTMPQPVTATTDNQSVNVLISWEPTEIEPGQDTEFTLDFQDPSSGDSIPHVNYNFEILDQNNGETVQSMTDLHTHSGSDEQTVTFDTTGSFNFVVTIIGTGIDPPFDTTQSGTAQTVITVGQQLAGATGAQSACDPTQMAVGGGGGQNATTNATTTMGGGGTDATAEGNATTTTTATNATMTANATTTAGEGGGNQTTTSSPTQLIEQACIAALNNDTQGVLMNLNLALNALGGNMTTTADVDDDDEDEGGEEEGEGGEEEGEGGEEEGN
jgi:hypothetical protein